MLFPASTLPSALPVVIAVIFTIVYIYIYRPPYYIPCSDMYQSLAAKPRWLFIKMEQQLTNY